MPARSVSRHEPRARPNVDPGGLHQKPVLTARPGASVYVREPRIQVIVDDDDFDVRLIGIVRQTETEVTDRFVQIIKAGAGKRLAPDGEPIEDFANAELRYA